jgi:hypothetical protein
LQSVSQPSLPADNVSRPPRLGSLDTFDLTRIEWGGVCGLGSVAIAAMSRETFNPLNNVFYTGTSGNVLLQQSLALQIDTVVVMGDSCGTMKVTPSANWRT